MVIHDFAEVDNGDIPGIAAEPAHHFLLQVLEGGIRRCAVGVYGTLAENTQFDAMRGDNSAFVFLVLNVHNGVGLHTQILEGDFAGVDYPHPPHHQIEGFLGQREYLGDPVVQHFGSQQRIDGYLLASAIGKSQVDFQKVVIAHDGLTKLLYICRWSIVTRLHLTLRYPIFKISMDFKVEFCTHEDQPKQKRIKIDLLPLAQQSRLTGESMFQMLPLYSFAEDSLVFKSEKSVGS